MEYGPEDSEMTESEAEHDEYMQYVRRLAEENDVFAASLAEIKQLKAELHAVKSARDGYMNKCNEAIRMVKSLQKRLDKQGK